MNEYLEALKDHPGGGLGRGYARWSYWLDGKFDVLQKLPPERTREALTNRFAWAIPNDEAIAAIAALSPIVEVGAGTGYWAYLLDRAGADVVAYDKTPEGHPAWFEEPLKPWFAVQKDTARNAVMRHPDRTLFLCWPPHGGAMSNDALRLYAGRTVAYVGEGQGGCTGSQAFINRLEREWDCTQTVDIPRWEGINDYLSIWERK